jgi:hypothetical protein
MYTRSPVLDATRLGSGCGIEDDGHLLRPVLAANVRPTAVNPIYDFDGVRYYKGGHYYHSVATGKRLHVAVWERNFGPIPKSHDIHHKDHNKYNNNPENLECLLEIEHHRRHMLSPERIAMSKANIVNAIAAAARKRRANPEWSSNINVVAGKAMAHKLATEPKQPYTCTYCGKSYKTHPSSRKRGFCSAKCQSASRRESGIDDERRICIECGKPFISNRYTKITTCSLSCGGKVGARNRLQHHR